MHIEHFGQPELADRYLRRAEELGRDEPAVLKCKVVILSHRGQTAEAARISRQALAAGLDDRWWSDTVFLRTARDAALDAGQVDDVLGIYQARAPRLFDDQPEVTFATARYAVDVVLLLRASGQDDAAEWILTATLEAYDRLNPRRIRGYEFSILDVEALALAGRNELALERLEEAVDSGWLLDWPYALSNRNLDLIRDEPRFAEALARLEARAAEQGANWLASPHLGEFDLRDRPAK